MQTIASQIVSIWLVSNG